MYKVKEAADQLGVSRVEIFEILLSQRDIFEPYVTKKNSITYISEEGLTFLRERIAIHKGKEDRDSLSESYSVEKAILSQKGSALENSKGKEISEQEALGAKDLKPDADFEEFPDLYNADDQLSGIHNEGSEFEQVDDALSEWLREIQDETLLSDAYDGKLKDIRTQITTMRNKILGLDSEIKMKEDALRHYHEIMKDDIRWLEDLERKMQLIVKHKFLEHESTTENIEVSEEEKGNFRKFFKR